MLSERCPEASAQAASPPRRAASTARGRGPQSPQGIPAKAGHLKLQSQDEAGTITRGEKLWNERDTCAATMWSSAAWGRRGCRPGPG